jgi:hypothetical protein
MLDEFEFWTMKDGSDGLTRISSASFPAVAPPPPPHASPRGVPVLACYVQSFP